MKPSFVPVLALLLALASGAHGAQTIRHQFGIVLKNNTAHARQVVLATVNKVMRDAPAAGKPISWQLNADLGIASKLFSPIKSVKYTPVQADFAGTLDFKDLASLKAFFSYLLADPVFGKLTKDYIAITDRMQYNVSVKYPPKGTKVYRDNFLFRLPAGSSAQDVSALLGKLLAGSPVKPLAGQLGGDLGLAKVLTPASKLANYDLGGSIDWKSLDDLVKFYKWLSPQKAFQDFAAHSVTGVVRSQYIAVY